MNLGESASHCLQSAYRLHHYLADTHLRDNFLVGPDPGIGLNLRFWRFLKSYGDFLPLPWNDPYRFMQTQGYWCLANWKLFEDTGEDRFRDFAAGCARAVLAIQQPSGHWVYPLPGRRRLVATIEGNWASLALLETYQRQRDARFLEGALRWYEFLMNSIGFQPHESGVAVNYFDRPRGKVPNNSTSTLYFFTRVAEATGESKFLGHAGDLVDFLGSIQLPSGEMPYVVESTHESRREHYLCYQYNAFEFLELAGVYRLQRNEKLRAILDPLAKFLLGGVGPHGASDFDCFRRHPEVNYYTAVLGAALHEAHRLELGNYLDPARRCYRRLLARQLTRGGFSYSEKDYGFLEDRRSYPRYQAMILFHLLCGCVGPIERPSVRVPSRKDESAPG